jgi:hypothetical protein
MDAAPRLKHAELLIAGLFHCAGVLLDRLVENGLMERIEIDAALEAVEDATSADDGDDETLRWLTLPARALRIINEQGERRRILSTRELCEILNLREES